MAKTTSQRIKEVHSLASKHFGDVKFVGLKYDEYDGWVAKISFHKSSVYSSITSRDEEPRVALKKLKSRMEKIIDRYNNT
ncbi:MAG: hypothetical protein U9N59_09790 [Campylobacterota bacterium]|nr:hypothetical protein [Campylobacterota bacterium]